MKRVRESLWCKSVICFSLKPNPFDLVKTLFFSFFFSFFSSFFSLPFFFIFFFFYSFLSPSRSCGIIILTNALGHRFEFNLFVKEHSTLESFLLFFSQMPQWRSVKFNPISFSSSFSPSFSYFFFFLFFLLFSFSLSASPPHPPTPPPPSSSTTQQKEEEGEGGEEKAVKTV